VAGDGVVPVGVAFLADEEDLPVVVAALLPAELVPVSQLSDWTHM